MPDGVVDPRRWRQAALEGLDRYLYEEFGGTQLSSSDLNRYKSRKITHGWRISGGYEVSTLKDVLVDEDFPYSAARIALPGGPAPLELPHLESDGALCVLPGQATTSTRNPVGVTEEILGDAQALIDGCNNQPNSEDFREEFLSYWSIAAEDGANPFISLIAPTGPSREIVVWRGTTITVCADDRASLAGWLTRWGVTRPEDGFSFHRGVLIWLARPMVPDVYPDSASAILKLAEDQAQDAIPILEECAIEDPDQTDAVIGAPSAHGTCFAGVTSKGPSEKEFTRGFRCSQKMPRRLRVRRCFGGQKVVRRIVRRADHGWVHGRGHDSDQVNLKEARVLILGCGAVGASIARLLAQSGIGHLTFVDDQAMDWPNISRHSLGAQSVRRNKAKSLAEVIRRDFPHLPEIDGRDIKFGLRANSLIDELSTYDLIVSATGEWSADALLNDVQQSQGALAPVMYAWLEPQATAAHAVLIHRDSQHSCLHCGFNECGVAHVPVTEWPDGEQFLQEPACGAVFSPFGAVDLTWGHALAAELALDVLLGNVTSSTHRVWIGRRETLESAGGQWSTAWCESIGDPGHGGIRVSLNWASSEDCPIHGRASAA